MKLIFISTTIDRGGAESLLLDICSQLKSYEVEVVYFKGTGTLKQLFINLGIEPIALTNKYRLPNLNNILKVLRIVRVQKCVIQGWMYHGNIIASLLWMINRKNSLFWAVHHSVGGFRGNRLLSFLKMQFCALFSQLPNKIVYVSEFIREEHIQIGYPSDNAIVIENGIDIERFQYSEENRQNIRKTLGITLTDKVIGIVGRNHPLKDYHTFFKGISIILNERKDVSVLLIGRDLSIEEFAECFTDKPKADLNKIIIQKETNEIDKFYSAMDVFVLSSISESFSLVILEALASGLFCVCTDIIYYKDRFGDAINSFKVSNAEEMAKKIVGYFNNNSDKHLVLDKAREIINSDYSLTSMLARYQEIWKQ